MRNPELYKEWVERAVTYAIEVGKETGYCIGCMQNMPKKEADIMLMGINPNENWLMEYKEEFIEKIRNEAKDRFFTNNNPENWPAYWQKVLKLISTYWGNLNEIIFTNILFWGYEYTKIVNYCKPKCYEMNAELVDKILKPKIVICASIKEVFNPLCKYLGVKEKEYLTPTIQKQNPSFPPFKVYKALHNGIVIYGIPHITAARWQGDENRRILFEYIGKDMEAYK